MNESSSPTPAFGQALGQVPHSRGALALAVAGHVIGAVLLVQLLDVRRAVPTPPLIVEILQPEPEIKKEVPPPTKRPPEPKVEQPPPEPDLPPDPLPQADIPPPPVVAPIQQVRPQPVSEQVRPEPVPVPVPAVRRPVEPVQPPPALALPKDPVRALPPPSILTARTPMPVQTVVEPPRAIEKPIHAPEAPRAVPREPPRRPVPEAPPMMEIAEAPLPPDADTDAVEPPAIVLPQPTGPAPDGPEIGLNTQMLTALYLRNPKPGYPAASRRLGEQGTVYLRVFVTMAGEAKRVDLKTTSGFPRLDRAALESVQNWKFVPAKRDDKPVDAWVLVPIKFSLKK